MSDPGNDPGVWQIETSTYLSRKPWLTLRQDRVRLPNGIVIDDYFVLEYPTWVNVVAVTPGERVVLVRQYRHGQQAVNYELPAGVCEPTDPDPLAAAKRELLEETGYGGGSWAEFMILSANPATHTNLTHTFLAHGVVPTQPQRLEGTEELTVSLVTTAELREIAMSGGVMQSLHAAAIFKYLFVEAGFHCLERRPDKQVTHSHCPTPRVSAREERFFAMPVHDTIERANSILPGIPAPDGANDPRWQAIIAVGEYVESHPDVLWPFVCRWGSDEQDDVRDAIATCLLEHLLEHHFELIFPRVRQEAGRNRRFADTFCRCWKFGRSEMPGNSEQFDALIEDCREQSPA